MAVTERVLMKTMWALAGVLGLVVAACGPDAEPATTTGAVASTAANTTSSMVTSTTRPATTTTAAPTTTAVTTTVPTEMSVIVYLLVDEIEEGGGGPYLLPVHRTASSSESVIAEAVTQLLAGPTTDEETGTPALSTAIPDGTELLGVDLDDGVATVDLSGEFDDGGGSFSMTARLGQLVYTVTRFPEVESLSLHLDGEPVEVFSSEGLMLEAPQTRDDYVDLLPAIFVDSPAWGAPVESPITVSGVANVFEATFQLLVTDDDGEPLFEETVTASCGTGCWGDFSVEVPYEVDRQQFGAVIVWDFSAEDGSRENIREYPIQLR